MKLVDAVAVSPDAIARVSLLEKTEPQLSNLLNTLSDISRLYDMGRTVEAVPF